MKRFIKTIIICCLIIVGFVLFLLSNQLGGMRLFIVSSASMEPTLHTGSLIATTYISPDQLQKGDIITFLPPTKEKEFVTHRITTIRHEKNLSIIKTKGDNNRGEDVWTLAGGAVVGKVLFTIPFLGYLFSFTQSKIGIILFILFPAVYIIIDEVAKSITLIKHHHNERKRNTLQKSNNIL